MDCFHTPDACKECPERVVCRCLQVTEAALLQVLTTEQISTLKDLRRRTGAGEGCTCCHDLLRHYLQQHAYASSADPICSCK
jgi:bacterioferritin-associated ferredoxin